MDTKHCQYVDNYLFTWSSLHDFDVKKQLRYTQHNKVPWPTVSIIRPSQQAVWRWVRKLFCLGRGRIKNCMKTNCSQERNFTKKQTFESDKRKYVFRTYRYFFRPSLCNNSFGHDKSILHNRIFQDVGPEYVGHVLRVGWECCLRVQDLLRDGGQDGLDRQRGKVAVHHHTVLV